MLRRLICLVLAFFIIIFLPLSYGVNSSLATAFEFYNSPPYTKSIQSISFQASSGNTADPSGVLSDTNSAQDFFPFSNSWFAIQYPSSTWELYELTDGDVFLYPTPEDPSTIVRMVVFPSYGLPLEQYTSSEIEKGLFSLSEFQLIGQYFTSVNTHPSYLITYSYNDPASGPFKGMELILVTANYGYHLVYEAHPEKFSDNLVEVQQVFGSFLFTGIAASDTGLQSEESGHATGSSGTSGQDNPLPGVEPPPRHVDIIVNLIHDLEPEEIPDCGLSDYNQVTLEYVLRTLSIDDLAKVLLNMRQDDLSIVENKVDPNILTEVTSKLPEGIRLQVEERLLVL
jgi:hypothetical protein